VKTRSWLVTACAGTVVAAIVFGKPGVSQGAGGGIGSVNERIAFSAASSAAGWIGTLEGQGVEANVVNERSAASGFGDAFCHVAITFNDAQGNVLHTSELTLGPGEIGRVALPQREVSSAVSELPAELLFRTTFQVLDTYRDGRVRPCSAIASVRVFDKNSGRTEHYVPIETR
jgi:hypothetical protein